MVDTILYNACFSYFPHVANMWSYIFRETMCPHLFHRLKILVSLLSYLERYSLFCSYPVPDGQDDLCNFCKGIGCIHFGVLLYGGPILSKGLSESSMVVVWTSDGDDSVCPLVRLKKRPPMIPKRNQIRYFEDDTFNFTGT